MFLMLFSILSFGNSRPLLWRRHKDLWPDFSINSFLWWLMLEHSYNFLKRFFFIFRERRREGEKYQCVVASHAHPLLGTLPATQAFDLTGNKLVTFWFSACAPSTYWVTPGRVIVITLKWLFKIWIELLYRNLAVRLECDRLSVLCTLTQVLLFKKSSTYFIGKWVLVRGDHSFNKMFFSV